MRCKHARFTTCAPCLRVDLALLAAAAGTAADSHPLLARIRGGRAGRHPMPLDMLPSHRLGLPLLEFDKPRLSGPDYLLVERRD
jgi:hypothetical protein